VVPFPTLSDVMAEKELTPNAVSRAHAVAAVTVLAVVLATVASIVLRLRAPMYLIADSPHDDMLYARLGSTLARGDWLGDYDGLNIAKGPGYPLFIAVAYKAHLQLKLAEQLVHLLAAAVAAVALARVLRSRRAGVAAYVILALDPAYLGAPASKVSRDALYGSASLLLFGGVLLALTSVPSLARRRARWWLPAMVGGGVALGVTAAGYVLSREERAWLGPALLVVVAAGLATWRGSGRITRTHVLAVGACGLTTLVVTGICVRWVTERNGRFYGERVASELVDGAYPAAIGQWQRVVAGPDGDAERVPVTESARAAVYEVSPTAGELEPVLEDPENAWRAVGCTHAPPCDYSGAAFGWAVRSAAQQIGRMDTGREAERFFSAMADEIEQGCSGGDLSCTSAGIGPLPPLATLDAGRLWSSYRDVAADVLSYRVAEPVRGFPSGGTPDNWDLMTGALRGVGSQAAFVADEQQAMRHQRPVAGLAFVYRWGTRVGVITALAGLVAGVATRAGRRRLPVLLVALAALVAVATRILVVAILDATAFDTVGIGIYVLPGTQFMVLFAFVGTWLLGEAAADRLRPATAVETPEVDTGTNATGGTGGNPDALPARDDDVDGRAPVAPGSATWLSDDERNTVTLTREVSVVMPCLNEAETLATCIGKARASLDRLEVDGEVVVADNGSTDGSQKIAVDEGARVVEVSERGYGAALRRGIAEADGIYVIMADADDSYALDDLGPFVEALRSGSDLVMGNRFAGGIEPGAMPALHRYVGNPMLSWIGRLFFKVPIHDFHCGMRGFRRDRVLDLGLRTNGMEFASEMVVRSSLAGLAITEVPTTLRRDGRTRSPHLRTWRDGWRHLRFLLAFSPRWLFLYPAVVLVVLGALGCGVLAAGPVTVGSVTFDIQTMMVAATVLMVGLYTAALALVSRAYAWRLGMLPISPRVERLLDRFTLEWGLLVGALMGVGGIASFVVATTRWQGTDFGVLTTADMRLPLLGMVLIVAGAQVALTSFVLSLTRIGEG